MSVVFRTVSLSADDIVAAMQEFDKRYTNPHDYDGWLGKSNYKYTVKHRERYYPVKHILSLATR